MVSALSDAVKNGNLYQPSAGTSTPDSHAQAAGESSGAPSTPSTAVPKQQEERSAYSAKASIDTKQYEELLSIKNQYTEMMEKQKKQDEENENLKRKLRDWEQIGSSLGGSANPDASKKIIDDLKQKEVKKVVDSINEIMPALEKEYSESSQNEKESMKQYLNALKSYQINSQLLNNPQEMAGAKGLVTILTKASRNFNTRFSEAEAARKAIELKWKSSQEALEKEKKEKERLEKQVLLRNQSGTNHTIKPTVLPSVPNPKATNYSFDTNSNQMNHQSAVVSTKASSGYENSSASVGPSQNSLLPNLNGFSYNDISSGSVPSGMVNIRTNASASSNGNILRDIQTDRNQKINENIMKTRRVEVYHKDSPVKLEVRPWDVNEGYFTSLGKNYIGNQFYDWVGHTIKKSKINSSNESVFFKGDTRTTGVDFSGYGWKRMDQ